MSLSRRATIDDLFFVTARFPEEKPKQSQRLLPSYFVRGSQWQQGKDCVGPLMGIGVPGNEMKSEAPIKSFNYK